MTARQDRALDHRRKTCYIRTEKHDIFDNRLIFGDNLLALKALEQEFSGKVKCVFIDPPYNTGSAFTHYDDGVEHSLWLSLMRDRLEIIRRLLAPDGLLFVQIDYRECARLKIVLDEIFGESCFKNEIIVRRGTKNVQSQFETIDSLSSGHDTIYLYSKNSDVRLKKLMAISEEPDPGKWDTCWRGTDRPTMRYELFGITPQKGQWRWAKERAYKAKQNYEEYLRDYAQSMEDNEVIAKRDVAVTWCQHASDHAKSYIGKTWKYLLVPHDAIAENMTLAGLMGRFAVGAVSNGEIG